MKSYLISISRSIWRAIVLSGAQKFSRARQETLDREEAVMNTNLSDRLTIEEYKGMKYIYVDQTNLLPRYMVQLSKMHQELALKTGLPFITNFEGSYATP